MSEKSYIVCDFSFKTEVEAENAKNELNGVEYMRKRIDYQKPSAALSAYNMMNDKELFKTPVGISFMYEVRKNIIKAGVLEEDVPPVKLSEQKLSKASKKKNKDGEAVYKSRFINMIIVNVLLIIMLILFAIIASNSKNLNIINYQNRIDAEYKDIEDTLSEWSNELKIREKQIQERESELGID